MASKTVIRPIEGCIKQTFMHVEHDNTTQLHGDLMAAFHRTISAKVKHLKRIFFLIDTIYFHTILRMNIPGQGLSQYLVNGYTLPS